MGEAYAAQFGLDSCCPTCGRPNDIKVNTDNFDLSFVGRDMWLNGHIIKLTPREMSIMRLIAKTYPHPCNRERIFGAIWTTLTDDKIMEVYVCHLRKKLKDTGLRIANIRGVGYQLQTDVA